MCDQFVGNKSVASKMPAENFSPVRLIVGWLGNIFLRKRRVLRTSELSPDLLRDIGLENAGQKTGSLEEKWRRELDHLSR